MKIKTPYLLVLIILIISVVSSCSSGSKQPTPSQDLYALFQSSAPADTLPVRYDAIPGETSQSIPVDLFIAGIDSALITKMIYEPDTTDFQGRAYWKIALDDDFEACLLGLSQAWFKFKYLLIYSKSDQSFVDILPVAYLYGGDGGQIISESWIFDLESQPVILRRFLEHSIRMSETKPGEPEITDLETVGMKRWTQGEFQEIEVRDSSRWIQAYPLAW